MLGKQFIKQVTVTGADDSVDPDSLLGLSTAYPFIEFGILLSKNNAGKAPRFPSYQWVDKLRTKKLYGLSLSMHLCGTWVRGICSGEGDIFKDWISAYLDMFNRIQLNFHGIPHSTYNSRFISILKSFNVPIIFQMDGVNDILFTTAKYWGVNCLPLYDVSGGAGILPPKWAKPIRDDDYYGYAGGLSPENLKEQLDKLSVIIGDTSIWIDAETHLRSNNDQQFDIDKVIRFVEIAKPYVLGGKG